MYGVITRLILVSNVLVKPELQLMNNKYAKMAFNFQLLSYEATLKNNCWFYVLFWVIWRKDLYYSKR